VVAGHLQKLRVLLSLYVKYYLERIWDVDDAIPATCVGEFPLSLACCDGEFFQTTFPNLQSANYAMESADVAIPSSRTTTTSETTTTITTICWYC
jgi:hypothetical protein